MKSESPAPFPNYRSGIATAYIALWRFRDPRRVFLRPPARRLPQGSEIGPASRRSQRSGAGTREVDLENALARLSCWCHRNLFGIERASVTDRIANPDGH